MTTTDEFPYRIQAKLLHLCKYIVCVSLLLVASTTEVYFCTSLKQSTFISSANWYLLSDKDMYSCPSSSVDKMAALIAYHSLHCREMTVDQRTGELRYVTTSLSVITLFVNECGFMSHQGKLEKEFTYCTHVGLDLWSRVRRTNTEAIRATHPTQPYPPLMPLFPLATNSTQVL